MISNIEFDIDYKNILKKAGDYLTEKISQKLPSGVLFLSSAGSAFSILDFIDNKVLTENLTIGILDERYTQKIEGQNAQKFKETDFYKKSLLRKVDFLNLDSQKNQTLESYGGIFDRNLKKWKKENPRGFVIATLGIGEDGHTAGIMPTKSRRSFNSFFRDEKNWATGYHSDSSIEYPERITTTPFFLLNVADSAVVYVVGEKKKSALSQTLSKDGEIFKTPARIILEMGDVKIFTDINI